jgi:hypothetical protein
VQADNDNVTTEVASTTIGPRLRHSTRAAGETRGALVEVVLSVVLCAYVFWFRTHGLDERFGLYAYQVRDWNIALRDFTALPPSPGHPARLAARQLDLHTIGPSG